MRTQGYDGAANMAGVHRGVQAIIRYREVGACREGETKQPGGTLSCTSEDLYLNVPTVLTILLTMSVSAATPERSFSATRRVKRYVRSTMLTERLSSLALMHAYREMPIDPRESHQRLMCEQTKKACI